MGGGAALCWPRSPVSLRLSRNTWGEVATYVITCVTHKHLPSLTSTSSTHPHWLCCPMNLLLSKKDLGSNQTNQTKKIICAIEHQPKMWCAQKSWPCGFRGDPHRRKKTHSAYMLFFCINRLQYAFFQFVICGYMRINRNAYALVEKIRRASSGAQNLDDFVRLKKNFWYHLK